VRRLVAIGDRRPRDDDDDAGDDDDDDAGAATAAGVVHAAHRARAQASVTRPDRASVIIIVHVDGEFVVVVRGCGCARECDGYG